VNSGVVVRVDQKRYRRVIGMSFRLNVMPLCEIRVVSSFSVKGSFEVTGRFSVMARGVFVVLRSFVVVFGGLCGHSWARLRLKRRRALCAPCLRLADRRYTAGRCAAVYEIRQTKCT
jgi:hypothetical protein